MTQIVHLIFSESDPAHNKLVLTIVLRLVARTAMIVPPQTNIEGEIA